MNDFSVTLTPKEQSLGWCWLAVQVLALPVLLQMLALWFGFGSLVMNLISFLISFIATVCIFFRFLRMNLQKDLKAPFRVLRAALLCFFLYQICSTVTNWLIYRLVPDFSNANDANIIQMVRSNYVLMAVSSILLAPVSEELLFRGLIFGSLFPKSKWLAYCVSSLAFCLIHIAGYIGSASPLTLLLGFLQYIPAGLCLALSYQLSDSIWAPILFHITVNQIAMLSVR